MLRPAGLQLIDYLRVTSAHNAVEPSRCANQPSSHRRRKLTGYTARVPNPDAEASPSRSWQAWVTLGARLVLGITLLAAGVLKLLDLEASADAVRAYRILPYDLAGFVGTALPVIEVVIGLLLVMGAFTRISAILAAGLMGIFIVGIALTWARGISIDCGCFGAGGEVAPGQTQYPAEIARDLGLLLLGAWTAWKPSAPFAVDAWIFTPLPVELTEPDSRKEPS